MVEVLSLSSPPSGLSNPAESARVSAPAQNTNTTEEARIRAQQALNVALYYGGIYNKNTRTLIPFLTPESVSRSHSNNLEEITAEGRSVGVPYYSGGSAPTLSFAVILYEDFYKTVLQKDVTGEGGLEVKEGTDSSSVDSVLQAFRALTYPSYTEGKVIPPECLIMIGGSTQYRARCNSVSDTLSGITGVLRSGKQDFKVMTIDLSFTIIEECNVDGDSDIPSAEDIQERGGNIFG